MSDEAMAESKYEENEAELDEKLQADAIGETLYSAKWVLQTVFSLSKELPKYSRENENLETPVELENELESDLCTLWDMTADKDVAEFLQNNDIPSILSSFLNVSIAPRLSEICLGILANMACHKETFNQFVSDSQLLDVIEENLENADSQCVLQSVRYYDNCLWHCDGEMLTTIANRPNMWKSVAFILKNSLNDELLTTTIKFLHNILDKITDDKHCSVTQHIPVSDLIEGVLDFSDTSLKAEEEFDNSTEVTDKLNWSVKSIFKLLQLNDSVAAAALRDKPYCVFRLLQMYIAALLDSDDNAEIVNNSYDVLCAWSAVLSPDNEAGKLVEQFAVLGSKLLDIRIDDKDFEELQNSYTKKFTRCIRALVRVTGLETFARVLDAVNMNNIMFIVKSLKRWDSELLDELRTFCGKRSCNKVCEVFENV